MCIFMVRIAGRQFPVGQPPHLNSTVSIFWIFIPGWQVKYYHSKNLTSQRLSDIFCKKKNSQLALRRFRLPAVCGGWVLLRHRSHLQPRPDHPGLLCYHFQ